jgi:hypothetical protein
VFDARGRAVSSILDGALDAGERAVVWNGLDAEGSACRPGLYFVQLVIDGRVQATRSIALLGNAGARGGE